MMVFITQPKSFDKKRFEKELAKRKIKIPPPPSSNGRFKFTPPSPLPMEKWDKIRGVPNRLELIYIFNSAPLYYKLAGRYPCVNLGWDGLIRQENFFPPAQKLPEEVLKHIIAEKRILIEYFKKKLHVVRAKHNIYLVQDPLMNNFLVKFRKSNKPRYKMEMAEKAFRYAVERIFMTRKGVDYVKKYGKYIERIANYGHSLFRAYVYAQGYPRGFEVALDFYRLIYTSNLLHFYPFHFADLTKNGFRTGYLKTISRIFIEDIHKRELWKHYNCFTTSLMEKLEKEKGKGGKKGRKKEN